MDDETLAISMIVSLFVLLLLGYPVAFTLGGIALVFGFIGLDISDFAALPQRIYGLMQNTTLIAVPLFIFMGVAIERSGLAEKLLDSMGLVFGRVRGGVAFAVVIAGALLAASTGIVGASVVMMGLISLPVFLKRGYPPEFSCGLICASGTLGQIIPPSIVLVLLGDILQVPVGTLFVAAIVPGLVLVGCYLAYALVFCGSRRGATITQAENAETGRELVIKVVTALVPPLLLIVAVLGTIFMGIASPTEAAAVGAFGALVLALCHRRLDKKTLFEITDTTTRLSCMVFFILVGATAFGLVFRLLDGDALITEWVLSFPLGKFGFLALIMGLLFVLGCFLDFIEITFIVVPILMPIIDELGFVESLGSLEAVRLWFAVLIAMNLQMSFLTPPLGFALFYLKGVAPAGVTTGQIYRGIVPFVIIQALALALLIAFPEIVLWLPGLVDRQMFGG